jgi:hypothetical protein
MSGDLRHACPIQSTTHVMHAAAQQIGVFRLSRIVARRFLRRARGI